MKHSIYRYLLVTIPVCLAAFVLLVPVSFAQDSTSLLDDTNILELHMTDASITDQISSSVGNQITLSAKDGFHLWVVTLEGISPCDCTFVFRSDEFSAVWAEDSSTSSPDYRIRFSAAVKSFDWSIPADNSIIVSYLYLSSDTPVNIQVTFILPDSVDHFNVRYPMTAIDTSVSPSEAEPLPSYSEVVATYPPGTHLCATDATLEDVTSDGSWFLNGSVAYENSQQQIQCFGTKIYVNTSVYIAGVHYEPGVFLTVDKDKGWIQVSGWD